MVAFVCCLYFNKSLLFLYILLMFSSVQIIYNVEAGRPFSSYIENVKVKLIDMHIFSCKYLKEDKVIVRSLIGSSPPRCEKRCYGCGHCEAVQIPVSPQQQQKQKKASNWKLFKISTYYRGDYSPNYKAMSWKCKCGDMIFNP